jgi:hypothetical protein
MHQKSTPYFLSLLLALPCAAQAQVSRPPVVQWGVGAGINQYKEPGLMQLQGPELGLHARAYNFAAMPQLQLEGDVFLGQQRYTSTNTGSMNGVHNIETRWRALMPVFANTGSQHGLYAGLGIHTLWNDLRGRTSTNSGGYERSATQLWLPVRWVSNFWEVEAGVLVYGRHTSKLSQANTNPPSQDVVNTQKKGGYLQSKLNIQLDGRNALSPYVRYTGLGDSDVVNNAYEPASRRWQAGVTWQFTTP